MATETIYRGIYKSATSSLSGCIQVFSSQPFHTLRFPPQIVAYCELCGADHAFRFNNAYNISSPSMRQQYEKYCKERSIKTITIEL